MEPDNTADKAAGLELRSKIAYFDSQTKAQEPTPIDKMSLRKGPPPSPRPSTRPLLSKETTTSQQSPIDTTKEERERSQIESNVAIQAEPQSERSDIESKGESKVEPHSERAEFESNDESKVEAQIVSSEAGSKVESKEETPKERYDVERNIESKVEPPSERPEFESNIESKVEPPSERSEFESNVEIKVERSIERSEFESNVESKVVAPNERTPPQTVSNQPLIGHKSKTDDRSHRFNDELRAKAEEVALRKSSGWSPNDMEIFQRPMCLVGADQSDTLTICAEVVSQIEKIEWPMVVISVVGLYRTGKSYLMNRLAQSTQGFALGDTIESTTKGIWAWCKMHPERTNTVLLLLDTEGLGDVDKGDQNHDNKIFTLATLLCNCLVYNMKGAFDQDAVNKLTFVTEMASNIRYRGKASEDNHILNLILPDFVLCVRDFSLKLSKDGRKITEDEYLELSLAEKTGKAEHFNKPRQCIRKYFPKRKCFTFPVPGDGDVLENLETLRFDQLSNKFKETTVRFTTYIYGKEPKELITSKPVNGLMFATLATQYVKAIREGGVPDVDDAFNAVAKIENAKIQKEAIEIFELEMENIVLPVSASRLEKRYMNAQQKALIYLRQNVVHDKNGAFEKNAQMTMDNFWNELEKENLMKVKEICETKLKDAYSRLLKGNIEKKAFEVAGGYKKFQRDMKTLKKEYFSSLRDFEKREVLAVWLDFVYITKGDESRIIEADQEMSEKEKDAERKRSEDQLKKEMEQQDKANKEALAQQKREMDAHYQKMEADRNKLAEENKRRFEELLSQKVANEEAQKKQLEEYKKEQEEKQKQLKELYKKINDEKEKKNVEIQALYNEMHEKTTKHYEEQQRARDELAEEKTARKVAETKLGQKRWHWFWGWV